MIPPAVTCHSRFAWTLCSVTLGTDHSIVKCSFGLRDAARVSASSHRLTLAVSNPHDMWLL